MQINNLTGLPALISERNRVVLDRSVRKFHGIELDGTVFMQSFGHALRLLPAGGPGIVKHISAGRFNLPGDWVREHGLAPGQYVFLLASSCGLLVLPPSMPCISKTGAAYVIGIPCNILGHGQISVPRIFLKQYGLPLSTTLFLEKRAGELAYRSSEMSAPNPQERPVRISGSLLHLPQAWLREHKLVPGDKVYLIGLSYGFVLCSGPSGKYHCSL